MSVLRPYVKPNGVIAANLVKYDGDPQSVTLLLFCLQIY